MSAAKIEEASIGMLKTDLTESHAADCLQEGETGKKLKAKFLKIVSPEFHVKLYCCYGVIMVLTAAVVVLSAALSVRNKNAIMESCEPCYAACPSGWIGFGRKCFYFSEDIGNWTFSQFSCMALDAHLALFDSLEELNFLKRYNGPSDHWIGLHRESSEHPWIWTDNTEYNNLVLTRGGGECAYLSDRGIRSSRGYTHKKWICNKPNTLHCPVIVKPG
ncbi:C-type lectin domain family 2 member E-like [Arvicanthis niloticus]|uniref:C-type lectin domain family 2 member E-like n=1 Tax=Arvicanthis niloticus TaxID=61156 RepID=UPI001486353F|nr:C-type lectin domain family 2 member E-like [Arvicanthis niloticus]